MDIFSLNCKRAEKGDFIKDLSFKRRSMGYVVSVDKFTNMMKVQFPKTGRKEWVMWNNYGHYIVV